MIKFQHFPKSQKTPGKILEIVEVFRIHHAEIESGNRKMDSNEVLEALRGNLERIGFAVEKGKKGDNKIAVPVLYGENNEPEKRFFADAYNSREKVVLEVEAAAAVANNRFLKDLLEACVMDEVEYCVIAVRNSNSTSNNADDFKTVVRWIDTIYASEKLKLPLDGVTIIGY